METSTQTDAAESELATLLTEEQNRATTSVPNQTADPNTTTVPPAPVLNVPPELIEQGKALFERYVQGNISQAEALKLVAEKLSAHTDKASALTPEQKAEQSKELFTQLALDPEATLKKFVEQHTPVRSNIDEAKLDAYFVPVFERNGRSAIDDYLRTKEQNYPPALFAKVKAEFAQSLKDEAAEYGHSAEYLIGRMDAGKAQKAIDKAFRSAVGTQTETSLQARAAKSPSIGSGASGARGDARTSGIVADIERTAKAAALKADGTVDEVAYKKYRQGALEEMGISG